MWGTSLDTPTGGSMVLMSPVWSCLALKVSRTSTCTLLGNHINPMFSIGDLCRDRPWRVKGVTGLEPSHGRASRNKQTAVSFFYTIWMSNLHDVEWCFSPQELDEVAAASSKHSPPSPVGRRLGRTPLRQRPVVLLRSSMTSAFC